jgi:alkaline phosphatase
MAVLGAFVAVCGAGCTAPRGTASTVDAPPAIARSAIFLHPDGMGANTWSALRLHEVGPDGRLAWDRLPRLAIYVGPMLDAVCASSNGGATSHAYGVRAALDSYGSLDGVHPPRAASGKAMSVMREAQAAGKAIALVNSSSVTEPGTGAFLASVDAREDENDIAAQLLAARPDILLGGGEMFFLPRGVRGVHGEGVREDGRNLVEEARTAGYAVVRTRAELAALPDSAARILGLFAHEETFNEASEEALREQGLPPFQPQAPRFDEMIAAALERLRHAPKGYLLVGNEEGTDNLSGENNAIGVLDAAAGADRAIALVLAEARRNPALTVVVASDSDNGGMNATGDDLDEMPRPLPSRSPNGSPLDSDGGQPFLTPPDTRGVRQPFYIVWASGDDMGGGTVARGIGPGAALIEGTIDSTDVYRALYLGLFEVRPD